MTIEPALYQIASDGHPIFVAVDSGSDDHTIECEVMLEPDGTIVILDIREVTNTPDHLQGRT